MARGGRGEGMGFVACGPHPRTGLGVLEERPRGVRLGWEVLIPH